MPILTLFLCYWDAPNEEITREFNSTVAALRHCNNIDTNYLSYGHLLDEEGEVLWDHIEGETEQ